MRRVLTVLLAAVVAVVMVVAGRWYIYVTNTESPYDELGIALTQFMPDPVRAWGCGKLEITFAGALPPFGCSGASGDQWM